MKKITYSDKKACKKVQKPLRQEVKDLEQKHDIPSFLFSFNQENKSSEEKNGFLNRRPIQIKAENLHEGVFWLSKKNRDIIKSKILKIKEEQALRRSARIKKGQMPIENQALCAEGILFPLQNENKNEQEIAYISRDFQAFIPPSIRLGQGQFGTVSLVQNALTGKWHCLKILNKNVVQDNEPEILAVEGMLRAHETMPGGDKALISELIHGKSLKDSIQEISQKKWLIFAKTRALNSNMSMAEASEKVLKESFSFAQALALSISLVEAYESLHIKGYVHRDIKPDNIMFDREQKKCFAIDFGFVKKAGEKARWSGTFRYSSPEALNRDGSTEGLNLKDDIYALGITAGQIVALAIDNQDIFFNYKTLFENYGKMSLNTHYATQERYHYLEKTYKLIYPKQPEIQTFIDFYLQFMPIIFGAKHTKWQQSRNLSAQMIALCRLIYLMTEPLEIRPEINTVLQEMRKIRLDHIESRMTHFNSSLADDYSRILNELYSRRSKLSNAPDALDSLDIFLLGAVDINEKNKTGNTVEALTQYLEELDNTLKLKEKLGAEVQEHYLKKPNNTQKLEKKQVAEIQEQPSRKESQKRLRNTTKKVRKTKIRKTEASPKRKSLRV